MKVFFVSLLTIFNFFPSNGHVYKLDFGSQVGGNNWGVIDDGVMGGLSNGNIELLEESLRFSGRVSLENNGGFSSLKGPFEQQDLSPFSKVKIRYRATGYDFALTLEVSRYWFNPYFKLPLSSSNGKWIEVERSFDSFQKTRIGRKIGSGISSQELEEILRVGLITNEKRAGQFDIEMDYIEFL